MNNKRYLYIAEWNYSPSNGISKKIVAQVTALNKVTPTDLCLIQSNKLTFNDEDIVKKDSSLFSRIVKYYILYKLIKKNKYDLLYVRHINGFNSLLFFLVTLFVGKRVFINIEVPTYPFTGEASQQSKSISTRINDFVQNNYKRSINSVTYMGTFTPEIWGIPAIQFDNGVNVNDYKLIKKVSFDDSLHIIGVGSLDFWHGYDRAIEGIATSKVNTILHIVGNGQELNRLKNLAKNLMVEKKIIFYGKLHSSELDAVFEKCHLAIDSLGRHRSGNNYNSSIKSKEYCARGLPFIQSHIDEAFLDSNFVLKVNANDTPINFDEVCKWYLELNKDAADIRCFAKENLDWQKQFAKLSCIN